MQKDKAQAGEGPVNGRNLFLLAVGCAVVVGLGMWAYHGIVWLKTGHYPFVPFGWFMPDARTGWVIPDRALAWLASRTTDSVLTIAGGIGLWLDDIAQKDDVFR